MQVFNYEGLFLLSYFHHRNGKVYVGNLRKKKWIKNPEKKRILLNFLLVSWY